MRHGQISERNHIIMHALTDIHWELTAKLSRMVDSHHHAFRTHRTLVAYLLVSPVVTTLIIQRDHNIIARVLVLEEEVMLRTKIL